MAVEFKGKSLKVLETYVGAWDPYASLQPTTESKHLIDLVMGMHPGVVSGADAHQMIESIARHEYWSVHKGRQTDEALALARPKILSSIKAYVESLPRSYEFRIGLPNFPSWFSGKVALAEDVYLVADEPPNNRIVAALMGVASSRVHISISVNGYADHGPSATAARRALGFAHHITYLLKHFGVAERQYSMEPDHSSFQSFSATNGRFEYTPPALRRVCSSLSVAEAKLEFIAMDGTGPTLLSKVNPRAPQTDVERMEAFKRALEPVSEALKLRSFDDYEFLGAAMEWALESEASENDTVAYILASIGLEAILGTGDYMNEMSKRLGDRYAFLTGGHRADRERRGEEFKNLLDLRGEIVHARHRGLTYPEMSSLFKIQGRLDECIGVELNKLLKYNRPRGATGIVVS